MNSDTPSKKHKSRMHRILKQQEKQVNTYKGSQVRLTDFHPKLEIRRQWADACEVQKEKRPTKNSVLSKMSFRVRQKL